MKTLPVNIPPRVVDQIREQMLYIARESMANALAWEGRLMAAIEGLGDLHGHALDENATDRVGSPTRKLVFERTYLIHYVVNESAGIIEVANFRHGSRMPRAGEP